LKWKRIRKGGKMATRTVVALFDDFQTAHDVVRELVDHGFPHEDISVVASDTTGEYGRYLDEDYARTAEDVETSGAASGAGVGAGVGAVIGGLGGLLVGLGALAIPGIGPVLAAGPLAAALSGLAGAGVGAVAGGVAGGLIGALVDMGVPEEQANYYAEAVRRGGTLVTVQTDENMSGRVMDIMNRYNPVDVNERSQRWREEGWQRYDESATPYTREEVERERTRYREPTPIGRGDYADYDANFRQHYDSTLTGTGYDYHYYEPGYRFGYDIAKDERYSHRDWAEFEMDARQEWENRPDRPGPWEDFRESVRHAWERAKQSVR
jgi:hypothetical protein